MINNTLSTPPTTLGPLRPQTTPGLIVPPKTPALGGLVGPVGSGATSYGANYNTGYSNPFLSGPAPSTGGSTTAPLAPSSTTLGGQTATSPGTYTTNPIPSTIPLSSSGIPTSSGDLSSRVPVTTPGGSPGGSVVTPNLTGPGNQVGNLTGIGAGQTFTYGGSTYKKNADGSISAVSGTSAPSTASTPMTPPPSVSPTSGTAGYVPAPSNLNPYTSQAPTYPGLVGVLGNTASSSSPQFQAAESQYLSANDALAKLRADAAQQNANILGSRTNLQEAGGEQGLLQGLEAGKESALTGEMNAAQAAAQAATSQQGTQQTGLAEAGGLSAPQTANPYGTYNPLTGEYTGYGGANGGGAATAGGVQTQVQQGASVQQMTGQQAQAQALAQNLNQLITSAGINPASPGNSGALTAYVNGALQWINNQTGDPKYQNFANLINEISSRYASILNQSGGTPTDQSNISHSIINGLASGQSIQQVLQSLDKNASDSINALRGASGANAAGANQITPVSQGSSGNTFGSFF